MRYVVRRETRRNARVSIGVPSYHGVERAGWLLQTLQRTTPLADVSLTLLDDGSARQDQRDGLAQLAEQYSANMLQHPTNEGVTRGWNDLVRFVDSEFCILLNDDLFLTEHWFENLIYFLENNECGAAAPHVRFCAKADVPDILAGRSVTPRDPKTKQLLAPEHQDPEQTPDVVMCALGCGFGFRRSVYDQLGGFDERTRQIYNESWFGTKAARDLKLPSYHIPAPRIWHLWAATFTENPGLGLKILGDRDAYEAEFGGGLDVTQPKFMCDTMPPRVVKWIGPDGQPREKELTIQ